MRITTARFVICILVLWTIFSLYLFWTMRNRVSDVEDIVAREEVPSGTNPEIDAVMSELMQIRHSLSLLRSTSATTTNSPVTASDTEQTVYSPLAPIPIVIFTYKRARYLKRCIESLLKALPSGLSASILPPFPIYVSQDGNDKSVADAVASFGDIISGHFQRDRSKTVFDDPLEGPVNYYHISHNYANGLRGVFGDNLAYQKVILLEEDIEVAPDFFEYMFYVGQVLDRDESLLCVSAFNDNGLKEHVADPMAVYRSDFFPGLGWMMTRKVWEELDAKWPVGFWDDWLRLPENRRGRSCIRPEISRTFTFGEKDGTSKGQFSKFLRNIQLDDVPVNWAKVDVSRLEKSSYDRWFQSLIDAAIEIPYTQKDQHAYQQKNLKVTYRSRADFVKLARAFNVMADEKANVPRGAYLGVVPFVYKLNKVFLVPNRANLLYSNE